VASPASNSLTDILLRLADAGVEFVLVGGLAAVAQGAPVTTFDVDIVHRRTGTNVDALLGTLTELGARYRGRPGGPPLPPSRQALLGPGHSLFMTDLGPVDVLGEIEGHRSYDDLLGHTLAISLSGRDVRVLSLEMLVQLKRGSTHPKDRQMVPILEAALKRKRG
jgi:predicted nucleotidyltransferase